MSRRGMLSALLLLGIIFLAGNFYLGKVFERAAVKASAQLAQGAASSFGASLDKALAEATNDTANKECPEPPDDSFVYRSDRPKYQQYKEGGRTFFNIYGKPCHGPLVLAFCSRAHFCDAKMPGAQCSVDGEWGDCKQTDIVRIKSTVISDAPIIYSDVGKGSSAEVANAIIKEGVNPSSVAKAPGSAPAGSGTASAFSPSVPTVPATNLRPSPAGAISSPTAGAGVSAAIPVSSSPLPAAPNPSLAINPDISSQVLASNIPPTSPSGGGFLPPALPTTPSVAAPTIPKPQNTFGGVIGGVPAAPYPYVSRETARNPIASVFSFVPSVPSFSPVVYLNQATQFIQTIITPPAPRVAVVAPVISMPAFNQQPQGVQRPSSSVRADLAAAPRSGAAAEIHVADPFAEVSMPSEAESAPAPFRPEELMLLVARSEPLSERSVPGIPLRGDSFTDVPEIASLNATSQQIVLFPETSFEEQETRSRPFSTGAGAHAISIVDLLSAVMTGSFAEVKRVVGIGREGSRSLSHDPLDDAPAREDTRAGSAVEVEDSPEPESSRTPPPPELPVFIPQLPKPAWNPALGISEVATPPAMSAPPQIFAPLVPVPATPAEPPPEEQHPPTVVETLVRKIGGFFKSVLEFFVGSSGKGTSAISSGRSGDSVVRLLADPPRAKSGTHTTLYWTSEGVDSCVVSTEDGAHIGSGTEGTTLTPVITEDTTFSAVCSGGGETVSARVRVGVQ